MDNKTPAHSPRSAFVVMNSYGAQFSSPDFERAAERVTSLIRSQMDSDICNPTGYYILRVEGE